MPRYINEDDFCEYIRKNTTPSGAEWFISKIKDMPAADVVEVKYGEWERIESDTSVDFRCSVCHRYRFHNGEMLRKYKFCPNCGADMRKESKIKKCFDIPKEVAERLLEDTERKETE